MVQLWKSAPSPPMVPPETLQIVLSETPKTNITPATFSSKQVPIPSPDSLPSNSALVRVLFLSCDPAMRVWLDPRRTYMSPIPLGSVMRCAGVGEVVRSAGTFRVGDIVWGMLGWTEYAVVPENKLTYAHVPSGLPLSAALGVLGITGMTAYFGLVEVGKVRKRDIVVVSAAAGATGSVVCQIAKNVYECDVIGIAGGEAKCRYLRDEIGVEAVDYKNGDVSAALKEALGKRRINVYFDNVGGAVLEAALRRLARGGRVVLCGAISGYNKEGTQPGPSNYLSLISNRASMHGFLLGDFEDRFGKAKRLLSSWIRQGKLTFREDIVPGLRNAPEALKRLFEGKNIGKVVIKVADLRGSQYAVSKL